MANLSSSKKMVRKILKRTERNKSLRTNVRTYIRRFEEAIASGKTNEAETAFKIVQPKLMKLAQKGIPSYSLSPLSAIEIPPSPLRHTTHKTITSNNKHSP